MGSERFRNKLKSASITVEAAMVLPLFIIFTMQILSVFEMMSVYCRLQSALQQTAAETATYLFVFDEKQESNAESFLLSETFVREEVVRKTGIEAINNSVISGGVAGLHLYRSDIATDGKTVELILTYRVKPWFSVQGLGGMTLVNHCVVKTWTGYEKENAQDGENPEEETVYVTETGRAYHLYPDCSYLKADSHPVEKEELSTVRNENGAIYYPCEICCKGNPESRKLYYISSWGNRYHADENCRALVKNAKAISIHDVGERHLCSKCAGRKKNEFTN